MPPTTTPINPDRGLQRDSRGNPQWETEDILVDTTYGPFVERRLVPQPFGGIQMRLGPGGMQIYMYNDDPGVFLNERGGRVSEAIARSAGFDVDMLGKAARKKKALALSAAAVEDEFAGQQSQHVVMERGEYRLVEIAAGLHQLQFIEQDGRGSPLTSVPLPLKAAQKLFEEIAGPEVAPAE